VASRHNPQALWAFLVKLAHSDGPVWEVARVVTAIGSVRRLDDDRAMIRPGHRFAFGGG
jgi:hypothetical protein